MPYLLSAVAVTAALILYFVSTGQISGAVAAIAWVFALIAFVLGMGALR